MKQETGLKFYCYWDSKCQTGVKFKQEKLTRSPCLCCPPQDLIDGLTGKWTCDRQP